MNVLIAEDEPVSRRLLELTLGQLGHRVVSTRDGLEAWEALHSDGAPLLAILDWMMPGIDGAEVCRRLRARLAAKYVYVIMLTARGQKSDVVAGLDSGADDYLVKPFDPEELRSRIHVGERIVALESALAGKVNELESALAHVKQLQGILPICMHCKKIRDDKDTWHRIESYLAQHTDAMFTHSLCRECLEEHYPVVAARRRQATGG